MVSLKKIKSSIYFALWRLGEGLGRFRSFVKLVEKMAGVYKIRNVV